MKTCENCNLTFDDAKKFCFKCGAPLTLVRQTTPKEERVAPRKITIEPKEKITAPKEKEAIPTPQKITVEPKKITVEPKEEPIELKEEIIEPIEKETPLSEPQKESIQPLRPAPSFSKALEYLEKDQIEKALEIFRILNEEGKQDKKIALYSGICEAINGDFQTAIMTLRPILNDKKLEINDVNINRGYLYLAYCLSQNSAGVTEIKKWTEKINYEILNENPLPQDELTNLKITEYLVNRSLRTINQSYDARDEIGEIVHTYLTDTNFTENSDTRIAEIWYTIGNKYAKFNLYADALRSYQVASCINPDESKYHRKVSDIEKIFVLAAKKRKRKVVNTIVFVITLIFIAGSIYVYGNTIKTKVLEFANKTEVMPTEEALVKDIDGNVYHTVTIGTQVWMVENLRTTRYNNGNPIPYVSDKTEWGDLTTGAYSYYDNDESNRSKYGAIYNWYAVADSRKIAPEGWHVPTDAEWEVLIIYMGGWETAGGKLKEVGTYHWQSPNANASNKSGFTGLPGGTFRPNESYKAMGYVGSYWSSTEYKETDHDQAKTLDLSFTTENANQLFQDKQVGMSVRCIKD